MLLLVIVTEVNFFTVKSWLVPTYNENEFGYNKHPAVTDRLIYTKSMAVVKTFEANITIIGNFVLIAKN